MDIDFEISNEQAEQFATELFYSTNLIADVKNLISSDKDAYEHYLKRKTEVKTSRL